MRSSASSGSGSSSTGRRRRCCWRSPSSPRPGVSLSARESASRSRSGSISTPTRSPATASPPCGAAAAPPTTPTRCATQARYPTEQLVLGAKVFRAQCSVCHTLEGINAVVELAAGWSLDQRRLNIAQLQRTKPFMPPFAGTPAELEGAGAADRLARGRTGRRPGPSHDDPAVLAADRAVDRRGRHRPGPIGDHLRGSETGGRTDDDGVSARASRRHDASTSCLLIGHAAGAHGVHALRAGGHRPTWPSAG